jgi:hypothetical protein
MNNEEISKKLEEMSAKIDDVHKFTHKIMTYNKWTLIVTGLMIVLPLLGLVLAIPFYLRTLDGITSF